MNGSARLVRLALGVAVVAILLVLAQGWLALESGGAGLAVAPAQAPLSRATSGLASTLGDLARWRELPAENRRLRADLVRLEVERERLLLLQQENERLNRLLGLRTTAWPEGLAARVAARDPNLWFSQLVLDKGTRDGVRRNMVVLAPDGLVGRVGSVGARACRVRLVLDLRSAVPAMLSGSRALGVVYGEDGCTCVMKYIGHDVKVQEGEQVLTSGLGDLYPPGVPLGRVTRNYGRTEALFQSVQVRPLVDFSVLQEVLVAEKPKAE